VLLFAPLLAHAGGTIKGKVTFSGMIPPPKEFTLSKFPNSDFCRQNSNKTLDGETRLLKEVEVDESKGLKNAIVSLRDIKDKEMDKSVSIDGARLRFVRVGPLYRCGSE
jgi:hypothetical protein